MFQKLEKTTLSIAALLVTIPGALVFPAVAQTPAPSLADGIMCAARGKTADGARIYAYTSVIDGASLKKKPVSVTLVSPVSDVVDGQVLVIDKKRQTIIIDDFEAATSPEMQPVGRAMTVYQGKNTFSGKTQAGTPVSFTLDNNLRTFKLTHGNESYTGVCH
ncbi:hypothetical protein V0288_14245 [Pannus brasiliensis CCIBt3594]|uniref:Uncharacterized protein n=1 Tax=Pannus brasiliensis CCIBt3594 TaxID=1427578 RepID=A0AAW9QW68_9CHRO